MSNPNLYLSVRAVTRETSDTIVIQFNHPQHKTVAYKPGQYLTLLAEVNGKKIRRCYSLCSSPDVDAFPAVAVKKIPGGEMSGWLVNNLKSGQTLEVMEPAGSFVFVPRPDKRRHILLFAAGSGITPLISMLKSVLFAEPKSSVSLVYGNRNEASIIFKAELDALLAKYPSRLRVVHCLSIPPEKWYGASGRISAEMLPELLDQLQPVLLPEDSLYYLCGPQGLMDSVSTVLKNRKVPSDRIFRESFFTGTDAAEIIAEIEEEGIITREVTVKYDRDTYKFSVPPNKTILEAAQDLDIDIPYSCQSGLCTSCRGKCLSGKVFMSEREGLSDSELNEGYILTCVGHPQSDNVVIEIG